MELGDVFHCTSVYVYVYLPYVGILPRYVWVVDGIDVGMTGHGDVGVKFEGSSFLLLVMMKGVVSS